VLGASGLVGGYLLERLLADPGYASVVALTRRRLSREHAKLRQHIVNLDRPKDLDEALRVHDVFCCLGTTAAKAGSRAAFYKVDFSTVYQVAQAARAAGADQFLLVSSIGAAPTSWTTYLRVKGEIEQALATLEFPALQILRPSVLAGRRGEFRLGERVALVIMSAAAPLLLGGLSRYRPIHADAAAQAMVRIAKSAPRGINVFESDRLAGYAAERT
jgi:uncharacterized protein YbjT (DUF2867 family)